MTETETTERPLKRRSIEDGRLSHSSANLLRGCETRYFYYKVLGAKSDSDYIDSDGLSVGKAFHHVQETGRHEQIPLGPVLKDCALDPDIQLSPSYFGLVAGMSKAYWAYHAQSGTKVIDVEYKIDTASVVGYVDLISMDEAGKWYIEDLKAYKGFSPATVTGLARDPQLNLYAFHMADISKKYKLKVKDFGGVALRIVTKSSAKQKDKENLAQFSDRVAKLTKIHRVVVPAKELRSEETVQAHEDLQLIAHNIANESYEPARNYAYCMNYFSPCPYWSRCHGKTFTEMSELWASRVETFQL